MSKMLYPRTDNSLITLLVSVLTFSWVNVASMSRVLRIKEEIAAGTVLIPNLITYLSEQTYDSERTSFQTDGDSILAIGNSAMPGVDWFYIDPTSQSLVVRKPPDRDALCPTKFQLPGTFLKTSHGGIEFPDYMISTNPVVHTPTDCQLKISIVHGSTSNPYFDFITIILEDINDHAPMFVDVQSNVDMDYPFLIKVREVLDNQPRDSKKISLPLADDSDSGVNSIRGFRLDGEDAALFQLDVSPDVSIYDNTRNHAAYITSSKLYLVPTTSTSILNSQHLIGDYLNREKRQDYYLQLVVFDGGTPQRTTRLPIHIVVQDINDQKPMFDREWYSGQVMENMKAGQTIFEFFVTDADSDPNNRRINFRIPQTHPSKKLTNPGISDVQSIAAKLFTVEKLPSNVDSSSTRQIIGFNETNLTQGRLIVRHLPESELGLAAKEAINFAKSSSLNRLPESLRIDPDMSRKKSTTWFEFLMEAFDHGQPSPLANHVPVYINIVDINDHPPKIFLSYMQPTIPSFLRNMDHRVDSWGVVKENSPRAMVAQLTVTDEDSIDGEFEIVCTTSDDRFVLENIATHGHMIASHQLNFAASHSHGMMQPNGAIFQAGSLSSKMYKLMLVRQLDRESKDMAANTIEFQLTCTDNEHNQLPGGKLSTQAHVNLIIEDINDNTPIFSQTHYTLHVPENHPKLKDTLDTSMPVKYYIGQVHAIDLDEGVHGAIHYALDSNPNSIFEIEKSTGKLYLLKPFDRETTKEVKFNVLAIDGDSTNGSHVRKITNRLTATTEIHILVDDINDCAPKFLETTYHFEVEEGLDLATVGQVSATDADQSDATGITYRLAVGPSSHMFDREYPLSSSKDGHIEALELTSHFQIDPSNGLIRLKARLDREKRAHYEFIVLAIDNAQNALRTQKEWVQYTATATILITVLDQNDNAPQVVSPRNHAEFVLQPSQSIAGNTIFTIQATDADLGENGTIEYELFEVNNELERWTFHSEQPIKSKYVSMEGNTTEISKPKETNPTEPNAHMPFAIDRAAGICYLKENLPTMDPDGPRVFLLRIRVYDLGNPVSLNTTLVVRIIRKSPLGTQTDKIGLNQLSHRIQQNLGLMSAEKEETGGWEDTRQARISDRTMIVILSTVFILLLLTTIVLLLLIRYRRLFLRSFSYPDPRHLNESPLNKANMGFTAGKPPSLELYSNRSSTFPEVLTAPWVNQSVSSSDSPNMKPYSNLHNFPISSSRYCTNRLPTWSPPIGNVYRNMETHDNSAAIGPGCPYLDFSNSRNCSHGIQLYTLRKHSDEKGCGLERDHFLLSSDPVLNREDSCAMVLENLEAGQSPTNEYGIINGNPATPDSGAWADGKGPNFPNNWMKTETNDYMIDSKPSLRRIALSLEDLQGNRRDLEIPIGVVNQPESTEQSTIGIRNEYQPLVTHKWKRTSSGDFNYKQTNRISQSPLRGHSTRSPHQCTSNKSRGQQEKIYQTLMTNSALFSPPIIQKYDRPRLDFQPATVSPHKQLSAIYQYNQPLITNSGDKSRKPIKPQANHKQSTKLAYGKDQPDIHRFPIMSFGDQLTVIKKDRIPDSPRRRSDNLPKLTHPPSKSPTLKGSFV